MHICMYARKQLGLWSILTVFLLTVGQEKVSATSTVSVTTSTSESSSKQITRSTSSPWSNSTIPVIPVQTTESSKNATKTAIKQEEKMSAGAIAGIVIVVIAVIVTGTMGALYYFFIWRRKKRSKKTIKLPSVNSVDAGNRNSSRMDKDIPKEHAPAPPRPATLPASSRYLEVDDVYESYDEKPDSVAKRPMSYEVPTSKLSQTLPQPKRPPKLEQGKGGKFYEVSLEDSTNEADQSTYETPDNDDRDSYEVPVQKGREEHHYRSMFESSVRSDEYYSNVS